MDNKLEKIKKETLGLNIYFDSLSIVSKILINNLDINFDKEKVVNLLFNYYEKENILIDKNYNSIIFELNDSYKFIKENNIDKDKELLSYLSNFSNSLIFLKNLTNIYKEDLNNFSNSLKLMFYFYSNQEYNGLFLSPENLLNSRFISKINKYKTKELLFYFLNDNKVINNFTNKEKIIASFNSNKKGYIGFDPTAQSLHLGNYVMINNIVRFDQVGFDIYPMIGGATGMIGDPSGKSSERVLLNKDQILLNKEKIKNQLLNLTKKQKVLDNIENFENMKFLDFLRDVGKYINVNYLLEKEIIKNRLETGISFTEFSYTILQGYDFLEFYKKYNISIQIGGSDQWGNITTGVEMIRKMYSEQNLASGFTINLLVKSDGKKFGKSEKGAIFLDKELTSVYEMYQFLINQNDDDCINLLLFLTNLYEYEISIFKDIYNNQELKKERLLQSLLATKIIQSIHSLEDYQDSIKISKLLFKGLIKELSLKNLEDISKTLDTFSVNKKDEYELYDLLTKASICSSNRESREMINNNSISVNGEKINILEYKINRHNALFNRYTIIKKGKKNYFAIIWE